MMRLEIQTDLLTSVLKVLRSVVPSQRPDMPVHGDVFVSVERDDSGDEDDYIACMRVVDRMFIIHASVMLPVKADSVGEILVPVDSLTQFVSKVVYDTVRFEYDNYELILRAGRSQATIKCHKPEDFIDMTEPAGKPITLGIPMLVDMVSKVVHASSLDRVVTSGMYLEVAGNTLTSACLDSERMACSFNQELSENVDDVSVLVPADQAKVVVKLLSALSNLSVCDVYIESGYVFFKTDNIAVRLSAISARFPDFRLMIPSEARFVADVETQSALNAVAWSATIGEDRIEVDFLVRKGEVSFACYSKELGSAIQTVPAEIKGGDVSLLTYTSHLLEQIKIIAKLGFDKVRFLSAGDGMPLLVQPVPDDDGAGEDYMTLIMPLAGQTVIHQNRSLDMAEQPL